MLTDTTVESIIKFLGVCSGATISIWKFFDYLGTRDKERSTGATKTLELIEADKKLRNDIDRIQEQYDIHEKDIMELKSDQKSLTSQLLDFFRHK